MVCHHATRNSVHKAQDLMFYHHANPVHKGQDFRTCYHDHLILIWHDDILLQVVSKGSSHIEL